MRLRVIAGMLAAMAALAPAPSSAWGFDIHRFIVGRALDILPEGLRPFYEKYRAFIVEHTVDPDLWRTAGWNEEPPHHYLDLDAYGLPPFAAMPRDYDRAVEIWGREFVDRNGTLPWRTAEIYGQLQRAFQQQKKGAPYSIDNVKFYSAVLAHYVADGHVPLHAVVNHDGQLTGQHGIHARWETELAMRDFATLTVTPAPPTPISDPRGFMFDVLQDSFPRAEAILRADALAASGREVYDEAYFRVLDRETRPLLERQLSRAISAVASMIYGAWDAAGRPDLALDYPKQPKKVTSRY